MRLRDRKLTYTGKSVHFTGIFTTEQCRGLTHTIWKITIGMLFILVYIILERAGHRAQRKYFFIVFLITQYEHAVLIMIPVSGDLVEIRFCHERCTGTHITPVIILEIFDPSLQFHDHLGSLRCKERKPLSDHINGGKQSHLTAEFVVVTTLCVL